MNKCIFLDRDGVLNVDRVDYVYRIEDLIIPEGTVEALERLKAAGYLLIVITNQSGILPSSRKLQLSISYSQAWLIDDRKGYCEIPN